MRTLLLSLAFSILLVGCKDEPRAAATEAAPVERADVVAAKSKDAPIPEITIEDADKAFQSGAIAVDANSDRTREKNGTVPGAIILSSSSKYDLAQLPEDKSKDLIFYCSNTNCSASDAAAERAAANGHKSIHVMREGIKGWKQAGKSTATYPQS